MIGHRHALRTGDGRKFRQSGLDGRIGKAMRRIDRDQPAEERIAELEGGIGALATSSGQAAQTLAILTIANAGDEIVSSYALYGGTYTLLKYSLGNLGIKTHFVVSDKPADYEALFNEKTKLVYLETIGNPKLEIPDYDGIVKVAHKHGIPVMVDS
jgi:O-acetylhomoserine/O-acetylserine sulfhydrylase